MSKENLKEILRSYQIIKTGVEVWEKIKNAVGKLVRVSHTQDFNHV